MLEREHGVTRGLLAMIADMSPGKPRARAIKVVAEDLRIMLQIEEELLYPAIRSHGAFPIAPAVRHALRAALAALEACPEESLHLPALTRAVLQLHAVDCEDTARSAFVLARSVVPSEALAELGEQMRQRRYELRESGPLRKKRSVGDPG